MNNSEPRDKRPHTELLGLAASLNPFADHTSSQRGKMFSSHLPQIQVIEGAEMAHVFTGVEGKLMKYERKSYDIDCDIQIIDVIPRFKPVDHTFNKDVSPYYTVVYRRDDNNVVDYFNLERYTMCSEDYGYKNVLSNLSLLRKGQFVPKGTEFSTAPNHVGSQYHMGTNLNVCYLSHPAATEDAFPISESAAKKLRSMGMGTVVIDINPDNIPLNLYGDDEHYKFMPDVGESVLSDGMLCALRTTTPDSIIYDTHPRNLKRVQHLHDEPIYIPNDSIIVDIDLEYNPKVKNESNSRFLTQLDKYTKANHAYDRQIWDVFHDVTNNHGLEISKAFNTLVTRSISRMLVYDVHAPNLKLPSNKNIQVWYRKDAVKFVRLVVTYRYSHIPARGFKVTGRYGNKGTISCIIPDEDMPVDERGVRADIIVEPNTVINRMNPGQQYEQFINYASEHVRRKITAMTADGSDASYDDAYGYALEFIADVGQKWADIINQRFGHSIDRRHAFVDAIIKDGFYHQVEAFANDINQYWVKKMVEKYEITKSHIHFNVTRPDGTTHRVDVKRPVMIASEYWYLLYKMPHERSSGLSYTSQFHVPIHASNAKKRRYPIGQTPLRIGEDEVRNLVMTCDGHIATHIMGVYATNPEATANLARHLLNDREPSKLDNIDMTDDEIVRGNILSAMARHIFSTVGIDLVPDPKRIAPIINAHPSVDVGDTDDDSDEDDDEEELDDVETPSGD